MKILYIGNYRDQGSWGRVCRDYLLALIEAGADIAARPVLHTAPSVKTLDPRILKVESKDSKGAEICVQQLHHTQLLADTRFKKNIAIIGLRALPPKSIEIEIPHLVAPFDDTICVNTATQLLAHKLGGVVYPHPIDTSLVQERMSIPEDKYVFYFIGKLSQRKNLDAVITAFHREFARDEPVELLIKTSCDIDPNQAMIVINNHINGLKSKIGKYKNIEKYKQEKIMLNELIDENWGIIHNTGNCLIAASHGEYTSLVPNIALNYGNEVILNNGMFNDLGKEYNNVNLCDSNLIFIEDSKCVNLTNFEEPQNTRWYEISIGSLQANMRQVFAGKDLKLQQNQPILSHKEVGEQLLSRILQ